MDQSMSAAEDAAPAAAAAAAAAAAPAAAAAGPARPHSVRLPLHCIRGHLMLAYGPHSTNGAAPPHLRQDGKDTFTCVRCEDVDCSFDDVFYYCSLDGFTMCGQCGTDLQGMNVHCTKGHIARLYGPNSKRGLMPDNYEQFGCTCFTCNSCGAKEQKFNVDYYHCETCLNEDVCNGCALQQKSRQRHGDLALPPVLAPAAAASVSRRPPHAHPVLGPARGSRRSTIVAPPAAASTAASAAAPAVKAKRKNKRARPSTPNSAEQEQPAMEKERKRSKKLKKKQ